MLSDFDHLPVLPGLFGRVRQISYVVDDIDVAMSHWHEQCAVTPFLVARNESPLSNAFYRGEKAQKTMVNIAFAYIGDIQLELTELVGTTPSLYLEAQERNITGVHQPSANT